MPVVATRRAWIWLVSACVLASAGQPASAQDPAASFTVLGAGQPVAEEAMRRFAQEMEGYTEGRVAIEVDASASDPAAVIERVQEGGAMMGWVPLSALEELAPELAAMTMPYLFADAGKALELLEPTFQGPLLGGELRVQGLEPLAYMDSGGLFLVGEGDALRSAASGKIAIRGGATRAAVYEALGFTPVTAGPAGSDGLGAPSAEADDEAIVALGSQAEGLSLARQPLARDVVVLLANRDRFGGLPIDVQETSKTKLETVAAAEGGAAAAADEAALEAFAAAGGEIVDVDEEARAEAHAKVKDAIARSLQGVEDPSILQTVLSYAD